MEGTNDRLVLVSGATGYVAGHVIRVLLEANYKVKGTVRKLSDKKKYQHLLNLPGAEGNLTLVEADLLQPEGWEPACKDCQYVMHVASPFPSKPPKDAQKEVIQPAVNGTVNVLNAALKAGVKKVVVTSSIVAVMTGHQKDEDPLTEAIWSDPNQGGAYEKSKLLAEKAVWDFYKANQGKIEIAVVNPGLVLGPAMAHSDFTSGEILMKLMRNQVPGIPKLSFSIVDVREVATAHLAALENPKSDGKRHILVAKTLWMEEIAQILQKEFNKQGFNIKCKPIGKCPLKFVSVFDCQVKMLLPMIGVFWRFDNSRSKEDLGIQYTDAEKTIIDMAYTLIDFGIVPDARKTAKK